MNWYLDVLKNKYATFSGRARRQEFWMFALISFIVSLIFFAIDIGLTMVIGFGFLNILYSLAVLVPSVALGVRRLQDSGKSALWILIAFVPFIGAIVLLIFFVMDSEPGENKYGPNPKGA